jgi:2-iminobutanoate/2-iminopropanoate deaminase
MRIFTALVPGLVLAAAAAFAQPRQAIHPKDFSTAGPYSPGILTDGTLYAAGQTGADLKTGAIPAEFEAELKQCLDRIGMVLKEAGMGYEDVVSVQVFLTDMDLFQRLNAVYSTYFKEPRPARTTVGVTKLVGPAHVEITVTAHKRTPGYLARDARPEEPQKADGEALRQ